MDAKTLAHLTDAPRWTRIRAGLYTAIVGGTVWTIEQRYSTWGMPEGKGEWLWYATADNGDENDPVWTLREAKRTIKGDEELDRGEHVDPETGLSAHDEEPTQGGA